MFADEKLLKVLISSSIHRQGLCLITLLYHIISDYLCLVFIGRTPAVVLLGCFNAVAQQSDYPPLTYRAVKGDRKRAVIIPH